MVRGSLTSAISLFAVFCIASQGKAQAPISSALSIPQARLIQPAELNQSLQAAKATRPLILQVGSRVMFQESHIRGAEYAGPGSDADGLKLLKSKVEGLPKNKAIVLYCGCCPWGHCPNVGPAYHRMRALGFTNVKVLYIANNFGADWVNRGYLVDHGE